MREIDERRLRRDQISNLGIPMTPKKSFICNYRIISIETWFLLLYMICFVLSTSLCLCLCFCFCFYFCLFVDHYNHYIIQLCLRERHTPVIYRMLIVFCLYILSTSSINSCSLCFTYILLEHCFASIKEGLELSCFNYTIL